ncbi:MAG: alanine racemase [Microlunatus sp.]
MSGVSLRLDVERWRKHLATVVGATPGIVPVAKGNGYGFGLGRLAAESARLGVDTVAVGLASEVAAVRAEFAGDIVVMTPWRPGDQLARELLNDPRVITTVSRVEDLAAITALTSGAGSDYRPKVIIEILTSMQRHGIRPEQLSGVADQLDRVEFQGWMIHLPLLQEGRDAEAERLSRAALAVAPGTLWISHLPATQAATLALDLGGVPMRLRVGTQLWLGDPGAYSPVATVLDVHRVRRGDRAGYRQRKITRDGWLLVIAGGTAHGIGMEAPTPAASNRQRLIALAQGGLEATGRALSPYTVAGKKRWFLEPPHMQASLVLLPASEQPPAIGDEVPVELRLTTALVDQIIDL